MIPYHNHRGDQEMEKRWRHEVAHGIMWVILSFVGVFAAIYFLGRVAMLVAK